MEFRGYTTETRDFFGFYGKTKNFEFYNRKNSNHIENKYMIIFTVGPVSLIGEI